MDSGGTLVKSGDSTTFNVVPSSLTLTYRFDWLVERHGIAPEHDNVRLVQGRFEDVLEVTGPVALAHIDGDWYNSVMTCLERIAPRLARGGLLVIDDYDDWSGCRKAVDEYFSGRKQDFSFHRKSRLQITRN